MGNLSLFNYGCIRATDDGRYSVYDTIEVVGGKKNPRDAWESLAERYPEVLVLAEDFRFFGQGQRLTPVATKQDIDTILSLLPHFEKDVRGKTYQKQSEERYRSDLHKQVGGKTEVCTPAGRIDILTSTQIVEVKHVKSWKSALGQIEVYGDYYPNHEKRLHLFGPCHFSLLETIKKHCRKRCIEVSWQR